MSYELKLNTLNQILDARGLQVSGEVQKFVDSEVLRCSDPYIPILTGTLKRSGMLGTDIGSGEVNYNAPYAAVQYYETATTRSYDAQRGSHWFERMKADHLNEILDGAKKKAGVK